MGNNSGNGFGFNSGTSGGGGGTNTNLGNSDLSADATRVYDINDFDLTIKDGGDDIAKFDTSSKNLQIGNANKYSMPTERGTLNEILGLSNGTGQVAWRTQADSIKYPAHVDAGSGNSIGVTASAGDFLIGEIDRQRVLNFGQVNQTTLNAASFYLLPEFKNNEPVVGVGPLLGGINLKFTSANLGNFDVYIMKLTMSDGTPAATTPCTFHKIGNLVYDAGRSENTFKCLTYPLINAEPELLNLPCSIYYLGIVPAQDGATSFSYSATYVQDPTITTTYT